MGRESSGGCMVIYYAKPYVKMLKAQGRGQ